MPESHAARGTRRGRRILDEVGAELRAARLMAGLRLRDVAEAAGISAGELSRIEHGLAPWLNVLVAARLCAIVGRDLWMRAYPGPDGVRDGAHVGMFEAFAFLLGRGLVLRAEVAIGDARNQRAWDATIMEQARATTAASSQRSRETTSSVTTGTDRAADADPAGRAPAEVAGRAAAELESRFTDAQALLRRIALKRRDSGIDTVILVRLDTRANRRAAHAAGATLRAESPLDDATVRAALQGGHVPPRAGSCSFRSLAARSRVK